MAMTLFFTKYSRIYIVPNITFRIDICLYRKVKLITEYNPSVFIINSFTKEFRN